MRRLAEQPVNEQREPLLRSALYHDFRNKAFVVKASLPFAAYPELAIIVSILSVVAIRDQGVLEQTML